MFISSNKPNIQYTLETTSSPSLWSVVRDAKENCEKKDDRTKSYPVGGEERAEGAPFLQGRVVQRPIKLTQD